MRFSLNISTGLIFATMVHSRFESSSLCISPRLSLWLGAIKANTSLAANVTIVACGTARGLQGQKKCYFRFLWSLRILLSRLLRKLNWLT